MSITTRLALILFLGGALAFVAPPGVRAEDSKEVFRQLNLFGEIFERVRRHYVKPVDRRKLIDAAVHRMLTAVDADSRSIDINHLRDKNLAASSDSSAYRSLLYLGDVFERILGSNPEKINSVKLMRAAINGMMSALDNRSEYIDPAEFRRLQIPQAAFSGVGVEISIEGNKIRVENAIMGTPAERGGIACGDIIVAIDGVSLAGLTLNEVTERMRGPENSEVTLSILGEGRPRPFDLTLRRENIRVRSVSSRAEGEDVGHVRITQFNEQTTENLKRAIAALAEQIPPDKMRGYIIDLRNNPGGLIDQTVAVSDAFLNRGEIIYTRGREPKHAQSFSAESGDLTKGKAIVVLINGATEAGAEMVAAALQDHRRATIVGTRSFGSGTIQTIMPLGGGNGALRLTTAHHYRLSGRSIEGNGVSPDYVIEQPAAAAEKSRTPCTRRFDDSQLQYALSLLRQNRR